VNIIKRALVIYIALLCLCHCSKHWCWLCSSQDRSNGPMWQNWNGNNVHKQDMWYVDFSVFFGPFCKPCAFIWSC